MAKKPKKSRQQFISNDVQSKFNTVKGADGSSLKKYYNPAPYSKVEFYLSFLNPLKWVLNSRATSHTSKAAIEHHNATALAQLKWTRKREVKFDIKIFFGYVVTRFFPLIQAFSNFNTAITYVIPFWTIVIIELFYPDLAVADWYLFPLYIFFGKCIILCYNLYWRVKDKIEIAKLLERSFLLEQRLAAALCEYFHLNLAFALIIKWLYLKHLIEVSGTNLNSIYSWILLSLDNMMIITTMLDITGKTIPLTISDIIYTQSTIARILFIFITLYNVYIASATVKLTYKLINTKYSSLLEAVS